MLFTRHADDAGSTLEMMQTVANSSNAFGIDLYHKLADNESNVFFSPWSITSAMLMVQEGARNQTADEIANVFHLGAIESWRPNYAGIYNQLHGTRKYTLLTVNALWHERTHAVNDEYIQAINQYYCGDVYGLDFLHQPEAAREQINDWVEEATENKIQDLLNPGDIDQLTTFVLTNALYFAGAWVHQFDPERTSSSTFYGATANVSVPFMHFPPYPYPYLNYTENEVMQMVELKYKGGRLSMFVVLPKDNLTVLGGHLSTANLTRWESEMVGQEVNVALPSFDLNNEYDLKQILIEMGMPTAFSPFQADLSGMDGEQDTYIGIISHQSFISVDELGTEAAAATVVEIPSWGIPYPFTANHPFLFYIRERTTGAILFMGVLQNPTS
jgi:serpin B